MTAIFSRIRFNTRQIAAMAVFVAVASIAQMISPTLVSGMIGSVSGNDEKTVILLAAAMIALAVVACVTNVVATNLAASLTAKFSADLRRELFRKVQGFSAAEIDRFGTASLISRNTADVNVIRNFLIMLFVAIPVMIVVVALILIRASACSVRLRNRIDRINQLFLETLEGVRVIRAFNRQEYEKKRFGEENAKTAKISRKSIAISGMMTPVVNSLFGLTSVGAMLVGSLLVRNNALDVSALVAAIQYINMILIAILLFATVVSLFPDAYACMKRIGEVLETETAITDAAADKCRKTCRGTVEFRNVTFAYPGADTPVIKSVSFVSGPGETTAIIGRTGCGKSSIVKLIPRLYDTLFGDVLVDGVNVKDYPLRELRDLIGYVPQKNVLFSGDIAGNLNFGNENGSEAEWKEAAHIACADEFVEKKKDAYHSAVAQGGTNFSGGQRQRLAIARAVMKKPEIYVFDDSFSALDMKTDKMLRQNLKDHMGDATMIVVAQRVNTIMDATRILVLENGEVVGTGTHRELLSSCGLYREIAEIQLGKEEVKRELESA